MFTYSLVFLQYQKTVNQFLYRIIIGCTANPEINHHHSNIELSDLFKPDKINLAILLLFNTYLSTPISFLHTWLLRLPLHTSSSLSTLQISAQFFKRKLFSSLLKFELSSPFYLRLCHHQHVQVLNYLMLPVNVAVESQRVDAVF